MVDLLMKESIEKNTQTNNQHVRQKQHSPNSVISSIFSQEPVVEWYWINNRTNRPQEKDLYHSLTNIDEEKIVVNVVKDKSLSKPKRDRKLIRKQVYTTPNTIIGSRTMDDLFRISTNPQSTSPIQRVIIIDRPEVNSSNKLIRSTNRTTQSSIQSNTQQLIYQPSEIHTIVPNHIYMTTAYIPNIITYYPSAYFSY